MYYKEKWLMQLSIAMLLLIPITAYSANCNVDGKWYPYTSPMCSSNPQNDSDVVNDNLSPVNKLRARMEADAKRLGRPVAGGSIKVINELEIQELENAILREQMAIRQGAPVTNKESWITPNLTNAANLRARMEADAKRLGRPVAGGSIKVINELERQELEIAMLREKLTALRATQKRGERQP